MNHNERTAMTTATAGVCFAAIAFGTNVDFWCHSLTGDSTDSVIVSVTFPGPEFAGAIASEARWFPGKPETNKHSRGVRVDVLGTVIEFPTAGIANAVRSMQNTYEYYSASN
jgi:hypothetical protein